MRGNRVVKSANVHLAHRSLGVIVQKPLHQKLHRKNDVIDLRLLPGSCEDARRIAKKGVAKVVDAFGVDEIDNPAQNAQRNDVPDIAGGGFLIGLAETAALRCQLPDPGNMGRAIVEHSQKTRPVLVRISKNSNGRNAGAIEPPRFLLFSKNLDYMVN